MSDDTPDDAPTTTVNVDTSAIKTFVRQRIEALRAELAGWDADSSVERAGQYRVGIDGYDVDDAIIEAICESISDREDFDVTADELVVSSVHIEPGEPSYVEVYVDE
jgi:hypothetical protein